MRKAATLILLLPFLACGEGEPPEPPGVQSEAQDLLPFPLVVSFTGLIAFAEPPGGQVVWALVPDADYDPMHAAPDDPPPCIPASTPPAVLAQRFPPHSAVLRFSGATVTRNGAPVTGPVPIAGWDLRFDTGKTGPSIQTDKLATHEEIESASGQPPGSLGDLDQVAAAFIDPNLLDLTTVPFLAARVLINFGDAVTAKSILCSAQPIPYRFELPNGSCPSLSRRVELAEEVEVTQTNVTQPVLISLHSATSDEVLAVQPAVPGGTVKIEILNVLPQHVVATPPNPCVTGLEHPETFRWFYRFLKATLPCDDTHHYFPCLRAADRGGNKCPQKGFSG